jgi:hypothetical protein
MIRECVTLVAKFFGDGNVVEKEGFGKVVAVKVLETQRPGWMCICKAVKIKL